MQEAADQYADELLGRAGEAAEGFLSFSQQDVDRVVEAVFRAAYRSRLELAQLAFKETGFGVLEHKVVKNCWASLLLYEKIRDARTVGALYHRQRTGITEIAQPRGPVLGLVPITNPTSTAIFKILICMKTRNPVIFSPHGGARKCIRETVRILEEAATAAGAPAGAIQIIKPRHKLYLERLMSHRRLALIIATGTHDVVRMAHLSGTPTFGVGPGNVPVYIDRTADLELAARYIVHSKTFDNGTVCASEQAIVVPRELEAPLREQLIMQGGYYCSPEEMRALGAVAFNRETRTMKPEVVGRPAATIAERAGFEVPEGTRLLIAEPDGIGAEHPLSHEILAPILAYYPVADYAEGKRVTTKLSELGGVGHTVGLFSKDEKVIFEFGRLMHAGRICVNQPTTQGAIGGMFNTLSPSLTLSCGTGAGNIVTDNITIHHLLNVHRVARRRMNHRWMEISRETWLDPAIGPDEIWDTYTGGIERLEDLGDHPAEVRPSRPRDDV